MLDKSKVCAICIAVAATLAVELPAFAQSFSASPYGTGNVLPFAYQSTNPDKIGLRQRDRYGYAMVPQTRQTHRKHR